MKLRTLLTLMMLAQPTAAVGQATEPPAAPGYDRFAPSEVDWIALHFRTPNQVYLGKGYPSVLGPSRHSILTLHGPPHYTADVVPGVEPDAVAKALRDGTELPGGVVRPRCEASGSLHVAMLNGSVVRVVPHAGGAAVVERDLKSLLRMSPDLAMERFESGIAFDSESQSFLVLLGPRPKSLEKPGTAALVAVLVDDRDPRARWRAFSVPTWSAVDFSRWLRDERRYGLFSYKGTVYWSVPEANLPQVSDAKRVVIVRSLPSSREEPAEVEIFGHLDAEVRQ